MAAALESLNHGPRFARSDDDCDRIVLLQDVAWEDYERLLELRGERSAPRIAFLDGVVELMSPSLPHDSLKSRIGRLVEVWCLEKDVEFRAAGAWTLKNKRQRRGVEADECYIFGTEPKPRRPHLAIEVVWTSGRMDKLEIYRRIGVSEVWVWRNERLSVHVLRGGAYEAAPASEVLRGIDLDELVQYLDRPTDSQCIREYRSRIRKRQR
jgi:Uma2 family endonuclease